MSTLVWMFLSVLVLLGLSLCGYFFQHKMIYFPERKLDATLPSIGLNFQEVYFQSSDGFRLHGWWVSEPGHRPVVLFCHGNAGNISHRLETLEIMHGLGLSIFIFDYRGFGRSEGKPSENGTYRDARAAWDYLREKENIGAEDIMIWGRSLGGPIAACLAQEKFPVGLVLESTFTSIPEIGKKFYPFLPVKRFAKFQYPTEKFLKDISCPVLIMHSRQDKLIPYSFGRRLYWIAREPKSFLEMQGSHNKAHLVSGTHYLEAVREFINKLGVW